jgi:NADH dehydrogenase
MTQALEDPTTWGRHYDLCGPASYTLQELVRYAARTLGLKRWVLGLGDFSSRMQARLLQHLPGKPFTMDNYQSLQTDSVCRENGLEALGIDPTPLEAIVPEYLTPRRRAG